MAKSTFFTGQPVFAQLCKYLDRDEILRISTESGEERYRKSFDAWTHLLSMLYAVMMRFDSLREIEASALTFVSRMPHLQMSCVPKRSTLGDANAKRSESIFGDIYFSLLGAHRHRLLPDSRPNGQPGWLGRLKIIDSTTVTLFSNLVFRGVGRDPKLGKKKGGIKVHTVISANEGVPGDIKFTSAATHDSFMLKPCDFDDGDVLAMDRAYIDYEKLEDLTQHGVTYVTKTSRRGSKELEVQLLTNSHDLGVDEVIAIYQRRWQIESLFKQLKQNFPLRYFYGVSENAIKTQIWVTLIANLLLTLVQRSLERHWSFSGLATMMRIILMLYIDMFDFFEHPKRDWERMLQHPPCPS